VRVQFAEPSNLFEGESRATRRPAAVTSGIGYRRAPCLAFIARAASPASSAPA
jgi:hypothetical protein